MKCISRMMTALLAAALLIVMTAASAFAAESGVDWSDQKITVQGMGVAPANARTAAQARMLARRAAVVDGYRQIAEIVKGVNVSGETTVENMMVTNDVVKTKVSALVQGARVVSEEATSDGGYIVNMEVSMFGVSDSLASAVLEKPAQQESFPEPVASVAPSTPATVDVHVQVGTGTTTPSTPSVTVPSTTTVPSTPATKPATHGSSAASAPSGQAIGGYTGLIVDCRGLGLKPAMSPVIKNANGQAIYGYKNLDYDKVVSGGMAGYTTDMSRATRAGSNPLVVKAVSLDNGANPVLSVADANRVLIENGATGFLDATNVVFIR
ncbi:LPP20 family lipoprotein [uncultured Selenomonas sp.]|uniref:LPP20 family lipoprotein n=2 Tax=uncultured Selenomonas sp. TaxID=159275 RepID=UPI0025ED7B14|nr:LPP20 family lipoprotein [uncultured Selenomonas sp.]MDD6697234.1 LPP20 family lipoprotein [Veillonellaceae bacterium]